MSKGSASRGFRFVGPTTMYALMQAAGMVDDHLAGCFRRVEPSVAAPAAPAPTCRRSCLSIARAWRSGDEFELDAAHPAPRSVASSSRKPAAPAQSTSSPTESICGSRLQEGAREQSLGALVEVVERPPAPDLVDRDHPHEYAVVTRGRGAEVGVPLRAEVDDHPGLAARVAPRAARARAPAAAGRATRNHARAGTRGSRRAHRRGRTAPSARRTVSRANERASSSSDVGASSASKSTPGVPVDRGHRGRRRARHDCASTSAAWRGLELQGAHRRVGVACEPGQRARASSARCSDERRERERAQVERRRHRRRRAWSRTAEAGAHYAADEGERRVDVRCRVIRRCRSSRAGGPTTAPSTAAYPSRLCSTARHVVSSRCGRPRSRFSSRARCSASSEQTTSMTRRRTSARSARSRHCRRAASAALTASTMTVRPDSSSFSRDLLGDEVRGETRRLVGVDARAQDRGLDRIDRHDRRTEAGADDLADRRLARARQSGHDDELGDAQVTELTVERLLPLHP